MTSEESNDLTEKKEAESTTEAGAGSAREAEQQAKTEVQNEGQDSSISTRNGRKAGSGKSEQETFSEERIQRILDIELPVNISFGSTKRPLSEVLKLGPGALLELNRAVDEPVVLKVNDRVFAKGEIVDVDGYYGVQITEISSPAQRIESLGD